MVIWKKLKNKNSRLKWEEKRGNDLKLEEALGMSPIVLIINLIMLSNPGNIQNLITKLLIDRRFEKAIEIGLQKYQIKQFKIKALTPN